MRNQVITFSGDESIVQATLAFRQAFEKLDQNTLTDKQAVALREHYQEYFLPELARNVNGEPALETYLPGRPATRHLHYHYIANSPHGFGTRERLDAAEDGSEYSVVHKRYHPFFRRISERFHFADIMLITPDTGDIIYTSEKNPDLGSNLLKGPFAGSNLARLVASLSKSSDPNEFRIIDFEPYKAARARPAAFVASPVFSGPQCIGLLVLQFPIEGFNRIVTGRGNWERDGLGETGEVYLTADDFLLRTASRFHLDDANAYYTTLRHAGYSADQVERIRRFGTAVMQQSVRSPVVEKALLGEEGTEVSRDYRGVQCLTSYGPLEVAGLHWVLVAKIDLLEAYAPAYALGRKLLVVLVSVVLLVSLLAVVLAAHHVRPVAKLIDGVRAVSEGRTDVTVELHTHDELRELADAFNTMTRSLASKTEQLELKTRENEHLLTNILPASAAAAARRPAADHRLVPRRHRPGPGVARPRTARQPAARRAGRSPVARAGGGLRRAGRAVRRREDALGRDGLPGGLRAVGAARRSRQPNRRVHPGVAAHRPPFQPRTRHGADGACRGQLRAGGGRRGRPRQVRLRAVGQHAQHGP